MFDNLLMGAYTTETKVGIDENPESGSDELGWMTPRRYAGELSCQQPFQVMRAVKHTISRKLFEEVMFP